MTNDPGNLISCSSYKGKEKIFVGDGVGVDMSYCDHLLQKLNSKTY